MQVICQIHTQEWIVPNKKALRNLISFLFKSFCRKTQVRLFRVEQQYNGNNQSKKSNERK